MINILIVEDEVPAQKNLQRLIEEYVVDGQVVGCTGSIESTCRFLSERGGEVDLILLDIELSDGKSFEIFNRIKITARVIVTTAFDNYAIKAFKIHSVDYLLKPIEPRELVAAVELVRRDMSSDGHIEKILEILSPREYKQRFTVKIGDKIVIVDTEQIAYFYSEEKVTFLVTKQDRRYIVDFSLDMVGEMVNPRQFFRLSRGCVASVGAIKSVTKHLNGRLKVNLLPATSEEIFVSRTRTPEFMLWLES